MLHSTLLSKTLWISVTYRGWAAEFTDPKGAKRANVIECQWNQPLVMYDNTFWPNPAFITVYARQPHMFSLRNNKSATCFTKSACLIHRYQIPFELLWGYFHPWVFNAIYNIRWYACIVLLYCNWTIVVHCVWSNYSGIRRIYISCDK